MKNYIIVAIIIACLTTGCAINQPPVEIQPNQPFVLTVNQTGTLSDTGLKVTFLEVLQDSRCPSQVSCVQRGQADILIEATIADEPPVSYVLNDNPPLKADTVKHASYNIRFVDLAPYPELPDKPIPTRQYQVTLLVTPN